MSGFAKQHGCPSSSTLASYHAGTLSFLARRSVAEHLAACEFCGAESALLSLQGVPFAAGERLEVPHVAAAATVAPPLPMALRLLAESVLGEMHAAHDAGRRAA